MLLDLGGARTKPDRLVKETGSGAAAGGAINLLHAILATVPALKTGVIVRTPQLLFQQQLRNLVHQVGIVRS